MSSAFPNLEKLPAFCLDFDRWKRLGLGEVVYGEGKTRPELFKIVQRLWEQKSSGPVALPDSVLVTRLDSDTQLFLKKKFPKGVINERARTFRLSKKNSARKLEVLEAQAGKDFSKSFVAVVTAGTTDIPVAEEAVETLISAGISFTRVYDVGIAGLHRLLARADFLKQSQVIIVVAGMEGALCSVLGGLFPQPILAVPTSVGYGASFEGATALHAMLVSCAPGIAVMNIDNGFGAGFAAFRIMKGRSN